MTRRTMLALPLAAAARAAEPWQYATFSKHLQWLSIAEAAAAAKECGYDALDLTVRKGGHIDPATVRDELPRAVETMRAKGLTPAMITTAITSAETPYAADILRAMQEAKLTHYRWGGWKYDWNGTSASRLKQAQSEAARLAKLNAQYAVCGVYHTHSGIGEFGASVWDIFQVLEGLDPRFIGINYDIGHATVEGGFGGWLHALKAIGPYLRGVALKDFLWEKNAKGDWRPQWKPLGEGMVDFRAFGRVLRQLNYQGPIEIHCEYPMGGADHGSRTITWSRDQVLSAMKQDLVRAKSLFA